MKKTFADYPSVGMGRRDFILSGLAASFVAGCRTADLFGRPALTFGVVSDIHVTSPGTEARYEKALRYFKGRGADAVMVCGDLADWGTVGSLELTRDAWARVFAGSKTVPLLCTGNHDFEGWWYGDMTMDMHASGHSEDEAALKAPGGVKAVWERVFGEKYAPMRIRTVKGYDFVSAEYVGEDGKHRPDAAKFLAANANRLRGSGKPFFYFQHMPINGTTGDSGKGAGGGDVFGALKEFPNAMSFTGHTHRPFIDERQIWQGAFTAIGTPSLSYPSFPPGHENGGARRDGTAKNAMPMIPARRDLEGRQGYFVNVYEDRVVIERLDLVAGGEEAAPAWIVPLDGAKPFAPAEVEKRVPVPAFPAGAGVHCEMRNTENRQGKWTIVMTCEFPSAVVPDGWRVFDYEIRAVPKDGSAPLVKRFLSPAYHKLPECEPARQRFWFDVAELPQDKDYTVEVRACNCFGKASAPIAAPRVFHGRPGLGKAKR